MIWKKSHHLKNLNEFRFLEIFWIKITNETCWRFWFKNENFVRLLIFWTHIKRQELDDALVRKDVADVASLPVQHRESMNLWLAQHLHCSVQAVRIDVAIASLCKKWHFIKILSKFITFMNLRMNAFLILSSLHYSHRIDLGLFVERNLATALHCKNRPSHRIAVVIKSPKLRKMWK